MADLDAALLAAHARGDKTALVGLYRQAAKEATADEARWFYLTHAWVFALDCGDPQADEIGRRLAAEGRA